MERNGTGRDERRGEGNEVEHGETERGIARWGMAGWG